jgi:integrase/recombinase XerD
MNKELNDAVKRIKGVKWSQTHKCWYLPLQNVDLIEIKKLLQLHATLDGSPLEVYKNKKEKVVAVTELNVTKNVALSHAWRLSKETWLH